LAASAKWFREAKYGLFVHYGFYSLMEPGEEVGGQSVGRDQNVRWHPMLELADRKTDASAAILVNKIRAIRAF
jgi:hypothetical protein